jgi:hypothetical protein
MLHGGRVRTANGSHQKWTPVDLVIIIGRFVCGRYDVESIVLEISKTPGQLCTHMVSRTFGKLIGTHQN